MTRTVNTIFKLFIVGGWVPFLVFAIHVFSNQVIDAYTLWPRFDIPMHFAGGMAFAFFISGCFQALPREAVPKSRRIVLELILIGSLTATATVFWEFAEFTTDQLLGRNVQVSLANTMKDMAVGILGALAFIVVRGRQLRAGTRELREVTNDWIRGTVAA